MKRKTIIDLIKAHYENDGALFFNLTLGVLKEFKQEPDCKELLEYVESLILPHITIVPKRDADTFNALMSEGELSDAFSFVPQSDNMNKERGE